MQIKDLLTWKNARLSLITILLGAVGSGVWEWLLKPALAGTSDVALSIGTLGVERFKDSLYQDIARGFREESSLRLHSAVFSFLPAGVLGLAMGFLFGRARAKSGQPDGAIERVVDALLKPVLILVVFVLVFFIVQASQVAYVNRAITHFNQLSAIAAPYLSESERLIHRSQFAQITSRADYVKVVESLAATCQSKNLNVPSFSVW